METSNKHANCLKDISNITRKIGPAFSVMKTTVGDQDKENTDPIRSVVTKATSEICKKPEILRVESDEFVSDVSSDGFEVNDEFQLDNGSSADETEDDLNKTQVLESGSNSSASIAGGSIVKEAPSPFVMSSLLNSRFVQDQNILDTEDTGASPMFPPPTQRQERRKLDFSSMDTSSPVSSSLEDNNQKMLFRRCISMVERGQKRLPLQLKNSSPEMSRVACSTAQDMTSPLSRPFASFKRPNAPLQPLSQNSMQAASADPDLSQLQQPCKKIKRGLSLNESSRNEWENNTLCKSSSSSNIIDSPQIAKPLQKLSLESESEANIKKACSLSQSVAMADDPNLTGDRSRVLSLPTVTGEGRNAKNHKNIDCHTLADVIRGKYDHKIAKCRIIDARYCYEYKGGHIRDAENFGQWDGDNGLLAFFKDFLPDTLGPKNSVTKSDEKAEIIVFHCEFSSERGPRLMSQLRKRDRDLNNATYPALYYPECYLLSNGYKEFFKNYPELCEPRAYVKMEDPNYKQEEKTFHKRSKTWGGPGATMSRTASTSRLLKL